MVESSVDKMKTAVFTKGLGEEQRKELLNYARISYDLFGEYSEEKKLLEDAMKRVVEKHGDYVQVVKKGGFGVVIVFDSIAEELAKELENLGIKIISFRRQIKIEKESRNEEEEGIEVNVEDEGKYKRLEPL